MLQFSLRTLLLVAVVVAVGCATLVHPTEIRRQAVVTMTVLILMISTLAAIFGQGSVRVTAGGFAIAGWVYFLLAFAPSLNIREHLLTGHVLGTLENVIHGEANRTVNILSGPWNGSQPVTGTGSYNSTIRIWDSSGRNNDFHNIGHALWALIFGMFGSFVAGWFSQSPAPSSVRNGPTSQS